MIIDQYLVKFKQKDLDKSQKEPHLKSLVKALTWRALGTIDTFLISWIVSGNFEVAFSIGAVELFTKTFLYYFHERMWNLVKWGKQ